MRRGNDAPGPRLPAGLMTAVGGPAGRRLRRPSGGPLCALAPVVLLLALPLAAAALRQAGCLAGGWRGGTPIWRQCGSPLVESVLTDDLGRGLPAFLSGSVRADEPVLTGAVAAFLGGLAPGTGTAEQRWFLAFWVALAAALLAGLVVAVGTARRHPDADPVVLALSPVLALTVLSSADLVPVALAVTALWAWSRDRARLAGALAGLAVLGGALAAVVLLAMALLPGREGAAAVRRLLGAAAVTVLAVAGVVALADVGTLVRSAAAWLRAGAGPGSPWYLFTLARHPVDATHVAVIAVLGWGVAAALVLLVAGRRPRPVVAGASVVGLATVLVTAPAFPPHASLWLLPFLALVGLGWRDHLLWAGAEAVHAVALYGLLTAQADPVRGLPPGWYALALSLRLLAVAWLACQVWLRADPGPDPDAGSRAVADGSASWVDAGAAGTLARLPSGRPVEKSTGAVGSNAYPPVTEGP